MKTIVVPTDFSPSADNAMHYAAQLAQTVDASVLLLHVYQIPISMNDVPVMMISVDDLKSNADSGLERVKEGLQKNFLALAIKTESRLGDVITELEDVCIETHPLAIVVGKHGASGVERFLFGSTTLSIIRHSAYPVISVPDNTTGFTLKNIALATDGSHLSEHTETIKKFVQQVSAQLHIIHVTESKKETVDVKDAFTELNAVHQTIKDEDFVHGIESYVYTHAIDMLMILPHKHSLMERLFFKTHTPELIQKIKVPIMCVPEE
jgi:nucleotide-binding universal stress UspA family protein